MYVDYVSRLCIKTMHQDYVSRLYVETMYQGYVSRVSIKAMYLDYVTMYLDYVSSLWNSPRVLAEEPSPCFREKQTCVFLSIYISSYIP